MKLVIMDLTGSMSVATQDGNGDLYILAIIKVSCCYPVRQLLKDKDKVRIAVQDVISILKCQSGSKVQYLYSDNSTKFINTAMDQFCYFNGIIYGTTNPYVLEQNEIAKWTIAIFFKIVCCILYSARIDLKYQGEAFIYVIHIRSLISISGLKGVIPYKIQISHLQIFGALYWAHIPKKI